MSEQQTSADARRATLTTTLIEALNAYDLHSLNAQSLGEAATNGCACEANAIDDGVEYVACDCDRDADRAMAAVEAQLALAAAGIAQAMATLLAQPTA